MALAEIITTIIAIAVFAAIVGYVVLVGYIPKSIPMHSVASPPGSSPCPFVSAKLKFNLVFGNKMPLNMTCGEFRELLQPGV